MEHQPPIPARDNGCRLVIRRNPDPGEIVHFVAGGIEVGQQIVTLAGPSWLKDLGQVLTANGFRPDVLLRNGRLIFLTAPDCFAMLARRDDPLRRDPLHLNGSVVRWVSDWSWAYSNGPIPADILSYQRCIHRRIHQMTAVSLCTVHCQHMERSSMLKMLVQHRRAARTLSAVA